MEGQSRLSELFVISWVSAVEWCPLSGVLLYTVSVISCKFVNSWLCSSACTSSKREWQRSLIPCAVLIMIQGAPAKFQFCQTFFYSRFGVKMVKLNDGQYFRLYSMLAYGW